jgi:hypothetical protein
LLKTANASTEMKTEKEPEQKAIMPDCVETSSNDSKGVKISIFDASKVVDTSQKVVKKRGRPRKTLAGVHVSGGVAKPDQKDIATNQQPIIQQEESMTSISFNVPAIDKTELETRYE